MTELDAEIPGLASEVIAEFGKTISYQRTTPGAYDTASGSAAPASAPVSLRAIVEPYRGQRLLAGLVEAGDLKVSIAAESFTNGLPTPEDIVTIDDLNYKVKNIMPTYSGELVALYELQVGR